MAVPTTRDVPIQKGKAALLIIDLQKYFAIPGVGIFKHIDPDNLGEEQYLFNRIEKSVIPCIQKLLKSCRTDHRVEVIYTFVECLTKDGRDQSLDYKLTGFTVPKGSPGAAIIDAIKPEEDDILIPKTSCSVFNSTNIEYVLRNLGRK